MTAQTTSFWGTTALDRFEESIYKTYAQYAYGEFKRVTKEVFYEKLYHDKLDKINTFEFDKENFYRTADEKHIWKAKYNQTIGEIWISGEPWEKEFMKSYWIKSEFMN